MCLKNLVERVRSGQVRIFSTNYIDSYMFNNYEFYLAMKKAMPTQAVEKVKGRRQSFLRIAERIKERITDVSYQKIYIGHADCLDEALELKNIILDVIPNKNVDIYLAYIGQMVGASVGPGMLGIYFWGTKETFDSEAK